MRNLVVLFALSLVIAAAPTAVAEDLWPSDTPFGPDLPGQGCRPTCLEALPLEGGPDPEPCRPTC